MPDRIEIRRLEELHHNKEKQDDPRLNITKESEPLILNKEVTGTTGYLKKNKEPRPDNITTEVFKVGSEEVTRKIYRPAIGKRTGIRQYMLRSTRTDSWITAKMTS